MKINRSHKGFTLIELLVVVSIIGMLSSVVLASLSTARTKANDSKIRSMLVNIRTAAEFYYSTNNSYGPIIDGTQAAGTTVGGGCASGMFGDTLLAPLLKSSNYPAFVGSSGRCSTSATGYAVTVDLSKLGDHLCIDGKGHLMIIPSYHEGGGGYGDDCTVTD
jgi:prepilin-type N-terminal cleavage/methylation domain-containing protein